MVPEDISQLLTTLYASNKKVGIAATGSGGHLFEWLLSIPGASSTVLVADVPYSMGATREYLSTTSCNPEEVGYSSKETAIGLAKAAYIKAAGTFMADIEKDVSFEAALAGLGAGGLIGVGVTAAVVSARPKRGKHRAHVATFSPEGGAVYHYLELAKGRRDRAGEDAQVARLALGALLQAAGVPMPPSFPSAGLLTAPGPGPGEDAVDAPGAPEPQPGSGDALGAFYAEDERPLVVQVPRPAAAAAAAAAAGGEEEGRPAEEARLLLPGLAGRLPRGALVFPGSYNPLHEGHMKLLLAAQNTVASHNNGIKPPVLYEIAVFNADKPPIPRAEVESRLVQFIQAGAPVAISKEPLFLGKAKLFPGAYFVVGSDTAERLIDPKYYNNDALEMVCALSELKHQGCHFVVGGRKKGETFVPLSTVLAESPVQLPQSILELFIGIDEEIFRVDLSSTELREKRKRVEEEIKL